MVESTAKLREEILALSGVDIMENNNTFKSTYKIMDELAAKWEDLSDIQQASVTELIAGKRQGNIVSSVMSNFDTAREALETSMNSEGSALEEHEKYAESLEYKLNSLKASWQSFAQTFMDSDSLKGGINALAGLVDILEKLIDNFGLLGTISLGVAGKGLWSYFRGAKEAKATLNDVVYAIRETSNANKAASDVSVSSDNAEAIASEQAANAEIREANANQASAQTEMTEATANTTSATSETIENTANIVSTESELAEAEANVTSTTTELAEAEANVTSTTTEATEAVTNLSGATTAAGASAVKATGGFKAFFGTLGGKIAILAVVVAAISAVYNAIKKAKEEAAALRQEAIESADAFLDSASSFEQAYIKYSGKTDLTVEEEAELEAAIKGTVDALDDKSSALQGVVNSSNDYVAALERIKDAELQAAKKAAEDKRRNAEKSLREDAMGWMTEDGSEVDVFVVQASNPDSNDLGKIAEKVGGDFYDVNGGTVMGTGSVSTAKFILPNDATTNEILEYYDTLVRYRKELEKTYTSEELVENGTSVAATYESVNSAINKLSESLKAYTESSYQVIKANYQLKNGIPKTTEEYIKMRNAILSNKDIKNQSFSVKQMIANDLDSDLGQAFDLGTIEVRARKFAGIIEGFGDGSVDGTNEIGTVETFLNMQTMLNNEECTVGEYLKEYDNITSMAENFSDEEREAFNLEFGLDTDAVKQQYDDMQQYLSRQIDIDINPDESRKSQSRYNRAYNKQVKNIQSFLDSLTADELAAVVDIRTEIDWENTSAEDIRKLIEDRVKLNEALNFNANIEVDKTSLEALNTVLEESASAMGLSEESIDSLKSKYKDLEGYNPHTLFEKTANGVKVNREELAKLEKKYNDLTKTEVQEHLDTLVEEYNKCTKAIDGNIGSQEKLELISKREKYARQIEELAEYQAQLEGVTGAYQKWIDAQNTPEDYEGYESVATGKEDIQEEIDRGFISNKGKAYIDLLSGENLEGKSIDDYYNAWEKLDKKVGSTSYSIHDFFTVNDDGDITSTGIDRFFKGLQQDFKGSVAEFNEKTGQWEYDFSQENLQKIQDEWGLGIEAIELLLEAAASAGYDVDWGGIFENLDLDTSNFESLVSVAEAAQKELNKLKGYEDIDFNFSTKTVEAATFELDKAQKVYNELVTNDDGTINLDAKGADNVRVILATLLVQKQQLEDSEIAINISTSGLDDAQAEAVAWVQDFRTKYKNLEIAISTGEGIEEAKTELETVKTSLGELDGDTAKIAAQLVLGEDTDTSGDGFKTQVNNAIDSIGKQDINVGFKLDETSISNLNSSLLNNFTVSATAKITKVDESQLKTVETGGMVNWTENTDGVSKSFEADGTVNWDDNVKNVKTSFSASGTVKWTSGNNVKVKVISEANGTANANGTAGRAFVHGNWGIKDNGIALGGELGRELVVRDGKFFTIGDEGAQFFKYRKNDIIFNAAQTESLFKYGGIKGAKPRGKMFVNGSAFAEGNAFVWNATGTTSNFTNKRWGIPSPALESKKEFKKNAKTETKTSTKDDSVTTTTTTTWNANAKDSNFINNRKPESQDSSKDKDKFEETIDFVEIALSRIEREIDNLDKKANNVYKSWSSRNKALADEISKVGEEIVKQNQGYDRYMQEADSVGLSETWAERVKNGTIDIYDENDFDEDTAKKIKEYREWFEKAIKCKDAIEELKETEASLYSQRFEHIQSQYDGILQGYEHTESMLNEYISQAEAQGHIVSKKYYDALISNEKQNISELKKEQADLIAERDRAVDDGKIVKGSEAWYDMCAEIDSVTQAIEEGTTSLIEYNNAIRDIDWQVFDLIQERISDITAESEFLIELMSNKDLFDDNGKFTEQGVATAGLHALNYNTSMYQADEYGKEVAELDKQIAKDPHDQELINRRRELIELQRESILAAEDEKNAIRDLVEEGINLELDALQEKIDKKNEELEAEKDLYDYQRQVLEQTEEIASLEKQMAAYSNDDSEEAKAKIQELKVSLEEAKTDLQETEWDRYIDQQSQLMDTLYTEYETILNTRLDNIDYLIEQVIDGINAAAGVDGTLTSALGESGAIAVALGSSATTIGETLKTEVGNVGTKLSTAMSSIWSADGTGKAVIDLYGKDFQSKHTTTNDALNKIKADVSAMVDDVDKDAQKKVTANKTSTSAKKDPTKDTVTKKPATTTTTTTNKSTADGKAKVGDKVKFVSGKYYYDSQGKKPLGSHNLGKEVYITSINTAKWATHPYHISTGKKLGSGDLGWLKLNQLSGYATGKKRISNNEYAWTQEKGQEYIIRPSDGAILTPVAKNDSILNATASGNIWSMANNPAEFIKDNLGLDNADIPNGANVNNTYSQHIDNVVFRMDNVKNYEEMLSAMRKDKNFERLVLSMTIGRLAGESSLAKNKSIR